MGKPLIALVQQTATELGLPVPQAAVRASDNTGRQLAALMTRCGQLMLRRHDWTMLQDQWVLTVPPPIPTTGTIAPGSTLITALPPSVVLQIGRLVNMMQVQGQGLMTATRLTGVDVVNNTATIDQPASASATATPVTFAQDSFPVPSDWERFIERTFWDRSMRWETLPLSPQTDQWIRSGIVATGPRRRYRVIGNMLRIWPVPYSGAGSGPGVGGGVLVQEYVSNGWAMSASGVPQSEFLADQDTCLFNDDLMVMGLKYLFFEQKGFDVEAKQKQWYDAVQNAIATDAPRPTLDMSRRSFPIFISPANVQDTGFGGVSGNLSGN